MTEGATFGEALRAAITDHGWSINAFARAYEGEGADDRQVRNRAGTVRRWLRDANTPNRLSVRRCEAVLELPAGTLESHADRQARARDLLEIQEQVSELYALVEQILARLDPGEETGQRR